MKSFRAPDGLEWGVEVTLPGSSNAMVLFRHPDRLSSHSDRYNWYLSKGPERSVTSRLSPDKVLGEIDDTAMRRLFARSMPVSRPAAEANTTLGVRDD